MKLNTAPENTAVMGNTHTVTKFKINSSAKAFQILSSGLYSNKIRAIIRELGCNAKDSHVDAGRPEVPFDVHLPTTLAPYFAIRDYGTGLTDEQVTSIYTTYFESTKTDSNDFIGALGLGSKSPYSYVENFMITTIKNGWRGVYSAFIDNSGAPAVVLMSQGDTDEPNGVEVRFAVESRYDFNKFVEESSTVFTHFAVKPNFTGANCKVVEYKYSQKDVVPGIHAREDRYRNNNVAVMGCIEYPIDLPNTRTALGALEFIDEMGLEIHFDIGDIEFQASREGLSYTKETIQSIISKYRMIAENLDRIFEEAIQPLLPDAWAVKDFVLAKHGDRLWKRSAFKWARDKKPLMIDASGYYLTVKRITIPAKDLKEKFNINPVGFKYEHYREQSTAFDCINGDHNFWLDPEIKYAIIDNTVQKKITTRIKSHAKNNFKDNHIILIMNPVDPALPMDIDGFRAALHGLPERFMMSVDDIDPLVKNPATRTEPVSLLYLQFNQEKSHCTTDRVFSWMPYNEELADMDTTLTNCYVSLTGYVSSLADGTVVDLKQIMHLMRTSGVPDLQKLRVFGVRKNDIEAVRTMPNWRPLEVGAMEAINNIAHESLASGIVQSIDRNALDVYNEKVARSLADESPFKKFVKMLQVQNSYVPNYDTVTRLSILLKNEVDISVHQKKAKDYCNGIRDRYPLLTMLRYGPDESAVVQYVKLIDKELQDV